MLPVIKNSMLNLMDGFFNDDLFNDFFTFMPVKNKTFGVNVIEEKDRFCLEIGALGFEKGDFKIDLNDDVLTISGEKKWSDEEKNKKYLRQEFSYSSFKRSFTLPEYVEKDKIEAKYKNGILTLIIPKKQEAKWKNSKVIEID